MYGATISFGQLLLYYINTLLYKKPLKFIVIRFLLFFLCCYFLVFKTMSKFTDKVNLNILYFNNVKIAGLVFNRK